MCIKTLFAGMFQITGHLISPTFSKGVVSKTFTSFILRIYVRHQKLIAIVPFIHPHIVGRMT